MQRLRQQQQQQQQQRTSKAQGPPPQVKTHKTAKKPKNKRKAGNDAQGTDRDSGMGPNKSDGVPASTSTATTATTTKSAAPAKKESPPKNSKRQKRNPGRGRSKNKDCYVPMHLRPPKLNTPEAIAKWREQRRKCWPTARVVAAKLAKLAKQEATESVDSSTTSSSSSSSSSSTTTTATDTDTGSAADSKPEGNTTANEGDHSSDRDATRTRTCRFMLHNNKCRNGEECKFSHDVSGVEQCDAFTQRGWCKWKKNCFRKHDKAARTAYQKEHGDCSNKRGRSNRKGARAGARNNTSRPTLLEKLLGEERNHETSVLLDCLEHMVEKTFWQEGDDGGDDGGDDDDKEEAAAAEEAPK